MSFDDFLYEYWVENEMEGESKEQTYAASEKWITQLDVAELTDLADKYGDSIEMKYENYSKNPL